MCPLGTLAIATGCRRGLGQLGAVVGNQVEDLDGVGVAVVGACGHSGAVGSGTGAIAAGRSLTIALHQIAYGLVLIGGFSLGLASVLTSLGLAAVYGQQGLDLELALYSDCQWSALWQQSALVSVCNSGVNGIRRRHS